MDVIPSSAQTASVPAPWSVQEIGSPAVPGSASFDQGQFTITSAGTDIWRASDQFLFVYQQVTGDVDVIARVDSVAMAHAWSKSGVMIRSSLAANAAHGFALSSAGKGTAFQRRLSDGGTSNNTFGPAVAPPQWVRLTRTGNRITARTSVDGGTWVTIGNATVALGSVAYVGLATTSHNASATTTALLSQVAVIPLAIPSPQQAIDIGAPAIQGSATYRLGTYTVRAAGTDIWGASDQFYFIYEPLTGDADVQLRVQSITAANAWSKTGVMIRETLAADSRHASALLSAGRGYAFQRRADAGGLSASTTGPAGTPPGWVRLVRTGSQFEAFQSVDGVAWTSMGSDTIPMVDTVYVGIATTSHNASAATTVSVDSLSISTAARKQNQPPQVAITTPTDGSTVTAGTNVSVSAAANDSDGTISRVDFFAGTMLIGSDTTQPYGATWQAVTAGTYTLTAAAVDNDGATTTSAAVTIQAQPAANQPPTVALTAPANGASFTAPATVTLSATASDADGTVARVEFYNGVTLLNSDTLAPYTFTWSSVAAGSYGVRAVAYDNAGASVGSATSTITVSASTAIPAPWTAADLGAPALSSSSTYTSGVFSVDAAGVDIWDTADQFHFIYQPITGDVEIVARVDALTPVYEFTNAGVMIRAALTGGSIHGYTASTASHGVYFRQRVATDGATTSIQGALLAAPVWVRLVRQGSLITSYSSTDGSTWTLLGSQTLALGATAYVGLAVNSHDAATRTSAQFSNVRVTTPVNQPPTATLTAPANGASFTAPATVTLSATASDVDGTIARVEFYNGTTLLNSDTAAPYTFTWASVAAGTYAVKAMAYDNSGASATSATSTITVSTTTLPPPTAIVFQASVDHATLVTSYELRIFASGADPNTATPVATSNLGKPTPDASGDITVDRSAFFSALAPGNYVAAVSAIGTGGTSTSLGVAFAR